EIWDEHDEVQNDIEQISETEYIVQGSMSVDDFYEYFKINKVEKEISTVNGWIMKNTDKIPQKDDKVVCDGLTALVLSVDGKRADEIKITVEEEENVSKQEEDI
ncbi:MAG TPA: hypothetical protein DD404_01955, partial [Ruminococcaceae bacterium]|nr:hypothetical protein [Oscillospiraceae bacterium]